MAANSNSNWKDSKERAERAKAAREAQIREAVKAEGVGDEASGLVAFAAMKAATAIAENKSVFSLREWDGKLRRQLEKDREHAAFARLAGEGWMGDAKWGAFRAMVARAAGMVPLAESASNNDWAMWSPKRHKEAEDEIVELARRLDDRHAIPKDLILASIAARPSIEEEQKIAAIASCEGNQAVCVTEGTAGAGKSFTLEVIKEVYQKAPPSAPGEAEGYEIVGTALSWTAAKVLQESAKLDAAQALQGLLMEMDAAKQAGGSYFKRRTLVVVDEAGLVGTMKMRALLKHAAEAPHAVRVLLTGDSFQLNPVEAGNALELIVDQVGSARLDGIRRQARDSHKAAVKHFCAGRAEQGLWTYWQQEALVMCENADERRERVMRDYVRIVSEHPMDACLALALTNEEVRKLNVNMRERMREAGLLAGDEHEIEVNDGKGPYKAKFCVGDRVVFRKNLRDHPVCESKHGKLHEGASVALAEGRRQESGGMFAKMISGLAGGRSEPMGRQIRSGVFNRSSGIVLGIKKSPSGPQDRIFRVLLNEGGEVEVDTALLRDEYAEADGLGVNMHHNFATTIYASQGQTVQRVLLMDAKSMNRRLAYVGMSRHKLECEVYADRQELSERRRARLERLAKSSWYKREKDAALAELGKGAFDDADLWAEMALGWNKEDNNQTVTQAQKAMAEKRERAARDKGSPTGRLRQGELDDPDDQSSAHAYALRPASYESMVGNASEAKRASGAGKQGWFSRMVGAVEPEAAKPARVPLSDSQAREAARDLPSWAAEPLAKASLEELESLMWGRNRWGEPRLYSLDKEACRMARWTFDGRCVAGRFEPPVMPNADESPWMVVQGAREAMMCWSHFKKKHEASPHKAPSIAIGFEGADLSALSEWVKPGKTLYCAWSAKDPASLDWARSMKSKLEGCGFKADLYPKWDPERAPSGSKGAKP